MSFAVKEIFHTLQGEGVNAGRPAVFLRFAGCNLWSGREADRAGATCAVCDTDFVGTDGDDFYVAPGGTADDSRADDELWRTDYGESGALTSGAADVPTR